MIPLYEADMATVLEEYNAQPGIVVKTDTGENITDISVTFEGITETFSAKTFYKAATKALAYLHNINPL